MLVNLVVGEKNTQQRRSLGYQQGRKDRKYQIWENRPLSVSLWSEEVFEQKLAYIYKNPIQEHWKLVAREEHYYYSSARFYFLNEDDFGFITHYKEGVR
jgi:putative transposase